MAERVECLYRVSTTKQVDHDDQNQADIPVQRKACRKFAEQMGWTIVGEEQEDGVSGFKVSANDRDKLQLLKDRAEKGKFDILLVFMFDRLGRKSDETPFVVEWFLKHGIRVWSVNEGEQRFESHTDRLTNYIRFWQADGESQKTSIRTKTALSQMVLEGRFRGGKTPYGYRLEKSGVLNNLQLYPSANILVATKKDFETKNRKRFCGRIATGDYDAIIIGHSQFEKIPMSVERQRFTLEQQLDEIALGIAELKAQKGENFSVKQLAKTRKDIREKLARLNDQSRKDDVVTFEELGVDRIFIDEAHYYKNLASFSKMRNVGGISQTEAQKSSDLYMKCRYLDELTGGRGVVFATGTPISNTMVELYTMQKYLQYETLRRNGLIHFDAWASTFGETVTAIELAPEGTGYRAKTRFARFHNLPELMAMFKATADIQTADMLNLPVPKAIYHNISLKPSELQRQMVSALAERAEKVRNREVRSDQDNMLLITNDGRKLALDQRLTNPLLPDSETSKVNACAENVFEIWQNTAPQRSAQMVFCDLSTPGKERPIEMVQKEGAPLRWPRFKICTTICGTS